MKIIISPAKKMNIDTDNLEVRKLPCFLEEAKVLKECLQRMTESDLQKLWKCNDKIAKLNTERLKGMDLEKCLTPAILAYEGIQYQYMAPKVLEQEGLDFLEEHLQILSGFYGSLSPFSGVVPYRLEMQAKLEVGDAKNLYQYWGDKIGKSIFQESNLILNLASKEYSKVISDCLPEQVEFVTCIFGEKQQGKIVEKGTLCKMARGAMVRFLAQEHITDLDGIKGFTDLEYTYSKSESTKTELVFLKG